MNAPNSFLRGFVLGFTLMCQMAFAMADGENGEFSTDSVPPCEKKMVEAMKAIDPFIEREPHTFIDDLMIRTPQQRLRDEIERLNKRDSALWTWENVMKECVMK